MEKVLSSFLRLCVICWACVKAALELTLLEKLFNPRQVHRAIVTVDGGLLEAER